MSRYGEIAFGDNARIVNDESTVRRGRLPFYIGEQH